MIKNKTVLGLTLKNIINSMLIIFLCSLIGTVLLGLSYLIQTDIIEKNMYESAQYISSEGMYPHLFEWCTSRLDNSTDSIMLLEASDNTEDSLINRIMYCYSGTVNGDMQYNALIDRYVNNIPFESSTSYARYWHGFIIFLRPLLCIMSYKEIRILNLIVQTALLIAICILLFKQGYKKYIIPYVISMLMIMPICIAYSLQFSTCYYISNLAVFFILLANRKQNIKNYWIIFLLIGCITSYLDFLTYPIATLGVPLIIYLLISNRKDRKILDIINMCIAWLMGYGIMWFNKWLFASILTDTNIIESSLKIAQFRTSNLNDAEELLFEHRYEPILTNFYKYFYTPFKYLLYLYVVLFIYKIIRNRKKINEKTILFIFIALLPIVWYFVVANHSDIHAYFANKALVVFGMAIMFALTNITENNQ